MCVYISACRNDLFRIIEKEFMSTSHTEAVKTSFAVTHFQK